MTLRTLNSSHWSKIREIYLEGIATDLATFETTAPDWDEWDEKHLKAARLGAFAGETLVGWAALSPVSSRSAYAGVAEVSVYVAANARGKGIGRALLERLIEDSEHHGIWTLQATIFPENVASLGLHERCGFRQVGVRERVSKLNGVWRDTVVLERRSKVVGVN